jgi:hypothetical protein
LQRAGRLALEEESQPDHDRHGERRESPQRDHDEMGNGEQQTEHHCHARPLEIVGNHDPNRKAARRRAAPVG